MRTKRKLNLSRIRRVVVKIGSSLLTDPKQKKISTRFLNNLAEQIQKLQNKGLQFAIVTSGAIATGLYELNLSKRPKQMPMLQALAAVGQSNLMHAYKLNFNRYRLKVAQILLTRDDLSDRKRYSNARHTLMELFHNGIIPVVNENDTVAVEEIKFGDNDTLGVLVSHLTEADILILLTDTDGFFNEDPRFNSKARLISEVFNIEEKLEKKASSTVSVVGTGGMRTKIQAAKIMMQSGVPMVIANGKTPSVLLRILNSEKIGTFFHPAGEKMKAKKRWLAWSSKDQGEIAIDEGAQKALTNDNKSLLPTGVRFVRGTWNKGDVVKIVDLKGQGIAKGTANISARELELIKGCKSSEVKKKLGRKGPMEVVHRDNLVKITP